MRICDETKSSRSGLLVSMPDLLMSKGHSELKYSLAGAVAEPDPGCLAGTALLLSRHRPLPPPLYYPVTLQRPALC